VARSSRSSWSFLNPAEEKNISMFRVKPRGGHLGVEFFFLPARGRRYRAGPFGLLWRRHLHRAMKVRQPAEEAAELSTVDHASMDRGTSPAGQPQSCNSIVRSTKSMRCACEVSALVTPLIILITIFITSSGLMGFVTKQYSRQNLKRNFQYNKSP
jgi:hypothetical protein